MPKKSKEDKRQGTRSKREELEDAFAKFDTDESGSLTVKEFADILARPARPGGTTIVTRVPSGAATIN